MVSQLLFNISRIEKQLYHADALDYPTLRDNQWCVLCDGLVVIAYVSYVQNYICSVGVHPNYARHQYGVAVLQYLMELEPDTLFEFHIPSHQKWLRAILRQTGFKRAPNRDGELLFMDNRISLCFEQVTAKPPVLSWGAWCAMGLAIPMLGPVVALLS